MKECPLSSICPSVSNPPGCLWCFSSVGSIRTFSSTSALGFYSWTSNTTRLHHVTTRVTCTRSAYVSTLKMADGERHQLVPHTSQRGLNTPLCFDVEHQFSLICGQLRHTRVCVRACVRDEFFLLRAFDSDVAVTRSAQHANTKRLKLMRSIKRHV